jgi:hypothetical protein
MKQAERVLVKDTILRKNATTEECDGNSESHMCSCEFNCKEEPGVLK